MKKILLVFFLFCVLSALVWAIAREKTGKVDLRVGGESSFEGLTIIHKQNGVRSWVLTAKQATISKDGSQATLAGIDMDIMQKGVKIKADSGRYDIDNKRVFVDGTITASDRNFDITTKGIEIDSTAGILSTDEQVQLSGQNFRLEGRGMDVDNKNQTVRIRNNVKATFNR